MKLIKSIVIDGLKPNFVNCNDSCATECCSNVEYHGSGATLYTAKNRGKENPGKSTNIS